MAVKEKTENIPLIGKEEGEDLNINFIKENENENDDLNSLSSNHKIKDENVKLFGDSENSKNSKEEMK